MHEVRAQVNMTESSMARVKHKGSEIFTNYLKNSGRKHFEKYAVIF